MPFLATGEGENDATSTEKHEGEQGEHDEDGKSLCLTDGAALIRQAGGASDGKRESHAELFVVSKITR